MVTHPDLRVAGSYHVSMSDGAPDIIVPALLSRYLFLLTIGNGTKPVKVNFWTRRFSGFTGVTSLCRGCLLSRRTDDGACRTVRRLSPMSQIHRGTPASYG